MGTDGFDLVVLGGGPAGYVAAARAAELGLKTACIDDNPLLGGTCLRVGCIPSKAMLESSHHFAEAAHGLALHGVVVDSPRLDLAVMLRRKEEIVNKLAQGVAGLLAKAKVTVFRGRGRFEGPGQLVVAQDGGRQIVAGRKYLIAVGSWPSVLPKAKPDGQRIGTSTEALAYSEVPKHLVVIGAGYIGLELGSVWTRLGAKVTVLEALPRILPGMDQQLAEAAGRVLAGQGLEILTGVRVQQAGSEKRRCVVEIEGREPITCDRLLLAVGRTPATADLGLDVAGIKLDDRGRIVVDENYATSAPDVYAIGDCIGGAMLAHKASDEGMACVEKMVTGFGRVNYDAIPGVVYTHPEVASVGQTEEQLKAAGIEYRRGRVPFRANGRALTLAETEGWVKVLAERQTDRVLGVHILGPRAGDLIAEAVAAIEFGASSEDIAMCCHAHPTLSETLREAARGVRS